MKKEPSISVIMRSKNDGLVIHDTLTMLFKQTIKNFELINIDSGSTDATVNIIKTFPGTLHQINPEEYVPGKVLNNMVSIAKGDLIVLLNSDATPIDEQWLENLIKQLDAPDVCIAFSRQVARVDAYKLVRFDYQRAYPETDQTRMPSDFISFAAAAFNKSVWEKYKFYEEGLSEDTAWANQLINLGYKTRYVHNSQVFHSHNLNIKALYRKEFYQSGVARVYIYNETPHLLKECYWLAKDIARDMIFCLKHGHILSIFYSFVFRGTQHLAFYQGRKEGRRKFKKDR
ncbi:MAG TPA: hypothetical protein DF296_00105 [Candidatus Margulisbacteria bacterium]|nr:MAG: hypothetical protein A2X42_04220 [Candidatus Margulisbacteria bacterium GWF2_38_17]OGI10125.1 MAG: hypothetical protein A2X41_00940 [Candidatus Margulisbacteria bacterium GWE2_39_32]HCT83584.1 hypothetical protein [Candidatus Margulisiibacteriota bacterium]